MSIEIIIAIYIFLNNLKHSTYLHGAHFHQWNIDKQQLNQIFISQVV